MLTPERPQMSDKDKPETNSPMTYGICSSLHNLPINRSAIPKNELEDAHISSERLAELVNGKKEQTGKIKAEEEAA